MSNVTAFQLLDLIRRLPRNAQRGFGCDCAQLALDACNLLDDGVLVGALRFARQIVDESDTRTRELIAERQSDVAHVVNELEHLARSDDGQRRRSRAAWSVLACLSRDPLTAAVTAGREAARALDDSETILSLAFERLPLHEGVKS